MNGVIISIDGACRRPGTPKCFAVGAYFIKDIPTNIIYDSGAVVEYNSTGQRGEILGLINALKKCIDLFNTGRVDVVYIISDSEYVTNCVNNEWYKNWMRKGWITADGSDVKNKDLWTIVADLLLKLEGYDVVFYHIKGHVIPFGKVTAHKLIEKSALDLYEAVTLKFENEFEKRLGKINEAISLFHRNNNVLLDPNDEVLKEMIVCNTVVDLLAGYYADKEL